MLRRAVPGDAREIGELHLRAWWWAYREIVAHELLSAHDPDSRERDWRAMLEDGRACWVREVSDRIAGFVVVEEDLVAAIYVDPGAQGAGVGTGLLAFAEERLRAAGVGRGSLWCLRDNEHARAFYAARGWAPTSAERNGKFGPEVEYAKDLA